MEESQIQEPIWAEKRRWWYSQIFIKFELIKFLQHRELIFLEKKNPQQEAEGRKPKVIRCAAGYNLPIFDSNLRAFRVLQFPYLNFYYSLMHLTKTPQFSFAPTERQEQYKSWTNGGYKDFYNFYDFGLDLDSEKSVDEAKKDAIHITKLFDEYKLPYSVRFSGSRGMHICIESKYLPQFPEKEIVILLGELAYKMKMIDNLPTLDDSIFDSRRVFKLPYSIDRGKVVLPLDDNQLKDFTLQIVEPDYVIKNIKIRNRGLLTRHTDQTEEQARQNFWRMAENFIEVKRYGK